MSSLYKVTEIEGKGLGCVAISDIKKGSLILTEKPQLCVESPEMSSMWIKRLLKSFYGMSKADQHEYMTLHNSFNNFKNFKNSEDIQNCKEIRDRQIEAVKFKIGKIEQDPEKAEEILKIFGICITNKFQGSVYFKVSRFNHACQPNAMVEDVNGQVQLRAIGKIKAGKEINWNYLDEFFGFRTRKYRQQNLLKAWGFLCCCELCKNGVDIDASFEASIQEAENLTKRRESIPLNTESIYLHLAHLARYYSVENCRQEIMCYKELYKVGRDQKIQPYFLFMMLNKGFAAAGTGYQLYKAIDLKNDAMDFAKAAEKFENILGKDVVTRGNTFSYMQMYQALG
jgi:hypothetical protein